MHVPGLLQLARLFLVQVIHHPLRLVSARIHASNETSTYDLHSQIIKLLVQCSNDLFVLEDDGLNRLVELCEGICIPWL